MSGMRFAPRDKPHIFKSWMLWVVLSGRDAGWSECGSFGLAMREAERYWLELYADRNVLS
jgi:hypothetical protein